MNPAPVLVYCEARSPTRDLVASIMPWLRDDDLAPYVLDAALAQPHLAALRASAARDAYYHDCYAYAGLVVVPDAPPVVSSIAACAARMCAAIGARATDLMEGDEIVGFIELRWSFSICVSHPNAINTRYIVCDKSTGALIWRFYGSGTKQSRPDFGQGLAAPITLTRR